MFYLQESATIVFVTLTEEGLACYVMLMSFPSVFWTLDVDEVSTLAPSAN